MKQTTCAFCPKPKTYEESCSECNKPLFYCDDCLGSKPTTCAGCSRLACFRCQSNLSGVSEKEMRKITFRRCRQKNKPHTTYECAPCTASLAGRLVANERSKNCFMCYADLEKEQLLYYSEKLNC